MALSYVLLAGVEAEHGPHRRTVGSVGASYPGSASKRRRTGQTLARLSRCPQRHTTLDTSHRRSLEGPSPTLPALPETSHRRFQRWIEEEVLSSILKTLAEDLQEERGEIDLSECYIDGTFVAAKKGGSTSERPSGAKARSSWRLQRALLFLSLCTQRVLRRTRSPLLRRLSRVASSKRSPSA